jgi:hypothetical protein
VAICSCGKTVDELYSYFDKVSKYRITCCEQCAEDNKIDDESKFEKIAYKKIKLERKVLDASGNVLIETTFNESLNKTPE